MKKALGFLKSNILIFIGALLLLLSMNLLAATGTDLANGIIGTIIAVYYIVIGVLGIFIGNKFNAITRKVFDIVAICLYALYIFLSSTFTLASMVEASTDPQFPVTLGPTAWFVRIFVLLAAFVLTGFYPFARLFQNNGLKKLCFLFAALFALALLLDILFDIRGFAITLGNVPFVNFSLELIFVFYLFDSLVDTKEEVKAIPEKAPTKEEKEEELANEEAPVEETKAEE